MRRSPLSRRLAPLWLCVSAVAALGLAACAPQDPAERVAELRGRYTAELNSFSVQETPLEPEVLPGEEGLGGDGAESLVGGAGPGAEGEAMDEAAAVEVRKDAVLDILIQNRATEPLAGLTLDIGLVDADKNEKAHYRNWVDTSGLLKGRGESFIQRLEDVPYEPGDAFYVEVRHPVPPAERGEYREFAEAGEAG